MTNKFMAGPTPPLHGDVKRQKLPFPYSSPRCTISLYLSLLISKEILCQDTNTHTHTRQHVAAWCRLVPSSFKFASRSEGVLRVCGAGRKLLEPGAQFLLQEVLLVGTGGAGCGGSGGIYGRGQLMVATEAGTTAQRLHHLGRELGAYALPA